MKLFIDPGHGGDDPGAQGNGLDEKDITLAIALKIRKIILNDYENVQVKMSRTSDVTRSLAQRSSAANAWDADFFLAIHINSADSSAQGYEDFIYNGVSNSSKAAKYQDIIHAEVLKVNQLKDRGQKKANFHVIRETKMPSLLTENGFISNKHDAELMKSAAWQQKVAQGHVNGIAKALGLKLKATKETPITMTAPKTSTTPKATQSGTKTVYTVYVGSYKSKENAQDRVTELKNKNIKSSIITTKISGATWYRVKVATYTTNANAEKRLKEIEKAGYDDAFIITEKTSTAPPKTETTKPTSTSKPATNASKPTTAKPTTSTNSNTSTKVSTTANPSTTTNNSTKGSTTANQGTTTNSSTNQIPFIADPGKFTILGPTFLSPEQMNQFVKKVNPKAPELGAFYQTFGKYYRIRGDVAFAQAIHETDYFRFTGVVNPEQNNYAGIGATGGDTRGASFDNAEEGVLAQLQHLFAYATTKPLPNKYPLVDPRFHLVDRGSAPTWTALNGKWAVPGTTYGQSILSLYEKMIHSV
ncbi:N-acetylmuramoyl-L-alanine amidase [Bacillus sp. sid0103]|uniref:N-acetylmuramoyl-L-alanine amidase n=1 Tax=Bacillus sp. sid0103 TaxID=2856337 RepID=UPI00210DBCE6|nr:N-acetylmuramoyl-L-alanine amidase [Bacillus sp. sid0103]